MDVLFGLVLGVAALGYIVWAVVSPFVVIGFGTRITELERQLNLLHRQLKENLSKTPSASSRLRRHSACCDQSCRRTTQCRGYEVEPKANPDPSHTT